MATTTSRARGFIKIVVKWSYLAVTVDQIQLPARPTVFSASWGDRKRHVTALVVQSIRPVTRVLTHSVAWLGGGFYIYLNIFSIFFYWLGLFKTVDFCMVISCYNCVCLAHIADYCEIYSVPGRITGWRRPLKRAYMLLRSRTRGQGCLTMFCQRRAAEIR